jgi:hypothetical protein
VSFGEIGRYLVSCLVLAALTYAFVRFRNPLAFRRPGAEPVDQGAPYRQGSRLVERPAPPPRSVAAGALLGFAAAYATPGWSLTSLLETVLALDPPPTKGADKFVVDWILTSVFVAPAMGILFFRSSLALARADARAGARVRAGGFVTVPSAACSLIVTAYLLAQGRLPFLVDPIGAVVLGAPLAALALSIGQLAAARRCA